MDQILKGGWDDDGQVATTAEASEASVGVSIHCDRRFTWKCLACCAGEGDSVEWKWIELSIAVVDCGELLHMLVHD